MVFILNFKIEESVKNTEVTVIKDMETIAPEDKTAIESGVNMQIADVSGKVLKSQKSTSLEQTFDLQGMSRVFIL